MALFIKPSIEKMKASKNFAGLLKVLNGKDEALANQAVPAVAHLITHAEHAPPGKTADALSGERMALLLKKMTPRVADVVMAMLEGGYFAAQVQPGVDAMFSLKQQSRLLESLDSGGTKGQARRSVITAMLFDSLRTGDLTLALALLHRITPDDDNRASLFTFFNFSIGYVDLSDGLTKLFIERRPEQELCELIQKSQAYHVVKYCAIVLGTIGTPSAIDELKKAPSITGTTTGEFNTIFTIKGSIQRIAERHNVTVEREWLPDEGVVDLY